MPVPYMMSNSATLKGAATLFLTTFTLTRLPTTSSPFFTCAMRRTSNRTDDANLSALPPGVVSGLPNIMPICMRIWFMNMMSVPLLEAMAVSLRNACAIIRAWSPMNCWPIWPSISAFGVSAATESTTTTSIIFERTSASKIFNASSPLSGWDIIKSFILTPFFTA